jgi:beta-fructofuranosidase
MTTSDGRTMMVAWMRSWSEANLTKEDLWCGAMTLPRELTLKDNHIYQAPAREINNYIKNTKTSENVTVTNEVKVLPEFSGRTSKITVDIRIDQLESGKCGIELFKGTKYTTRLYYDANRGYLVFDRGRCGSMMDGQRFCKVDPIDGKIKLEIYLDVNSVEVFVNNGYYTMTGTTFTPIGNDDVALFAEGCTGEFSNLSKSDIIV